jgi:hypothetical protein
LMEELVFINFVFYSLGGGKKNTARQTIKI